MRRTVKAGFGRLPGRTRQGSHADFRKSATISARDSMSDVIRRYNALISSLSVATPEILAQALTPTFTLSQLYVPQKTGALLDSGRLEVTNVKGFARAEIVYGNAKAWYAALVHEFVWLNHEFPTQAKYLQAAMEQTADNFLDEIAKNYTDIMLS